MITGKTLLLLCFRFDLFLLDGWFHYESHRRPFQWTHIVLNYIGPNNSEGIRIFYDGVEVASDTTNITTTHSAGDGRIVVGRGYTDNDERYSSVQIDELIFFSLWGTIKLMCCTTCHRSCDVNHL